ncbi:MAG: hypothetical protein GY707_03465 [Desulfobacteraceae bacterium]|nr:hypothetical protein [Desulfobacteraceae bacterium]
MSVKLNHYWSIIPGMDQSCTNYLINEFIPGVNNLGLQTVAVWSVLIGAYSEIVMENTSSDLEVIEKALKDKRYKLLKKDLHQFIKNYQSKILASTDKINTYTTDIDPNTIKFNQMWNVQANKKDDYDKFVTNEYFPVLNNIGISVAGEWEVLIGDGPEIICEGRVKDINNLMTNLQSKKFQHANRTLKQYIENFRSRILTFHVKNLN